MRGCSGDIVSAGGTVSRLKRANINPTTKSAIYGQGLPALRRTSFRGADELCLFIQWGKIIVNRKTILGVLLGAVMLLTACSTVPEEVSRDNEILNSVKPIDKDELNEDNYERLSMGDIRNSIEKTLAENKTNVLPGKVNVSMGSSMPVYKADPFNKNFEEQGALVEYLYGEKLTFDEPYCHYYNRGDPMGEGDPINKYQWDIYAFMGKEQNYERSLRSSETGRMFYSSLDSGDPNNYLEYKPSEKVYSIETGDELDDRSYKMMDGQEWAVKDAAKFTLDFFKEYIAPLERNEFTYELTDFRVKNLGSGYGYALSLQRVDKSGNRFDNHDHYMNNELMFDPATHAETTDNWLAMGYPYLFPEEVRVSFLEKEIISTFAKEDAPYKGEMLEDGEKLISLKQALEIVSANMADKSVLEFEITELEYFYVSMDNPTFTNRDPTVLTDYGRDQMFNTANVQIRPYWSFAKKNAFINGDNEKQHNNNFFLVDAITGQFILL